MCTSIVEIIRAEGIIDGYPHPSQPVGIELLGEMLIVVDDGVLELRAEREETAVLRFGAEAHHIFDPGPIVPTAIEQHHLAGGR